MRLPVCFAPQLYAQEDARGETVTSRARPDYDAVGIRAGSFLFFPTLDISETYNDNIFATQTNTDHDLITRFQPNFALRSDWNNHLLDINVGGDVGRYLRSDSENYEDFNAAINGIVDVRRDTTIELAASYDSLHEDRGSPDAVSGVSPTEYTRTNLQLGGSNKWNRVSLDVGLATVIEDYDDVALASGTLTNNDDRDRTKYSATARLGYEIIPQYEAFVSTTYNTIDYDSAVDDNAFNRDSDGYEVTVGTKIEFSGVLFGNVFVGYRSQDYDDTRLETIDGPTVGADLSWNITSLTTIKGGISRIVEETTQTGASGYFNTRADISVDHELLRNVLVGGDVAITNQKYRGNGREDDQYEAGAYAKYLINRNFAVSANYDFLRKNSNAALSSYTQNVFMVKLTTQY